MGSGAKKALLGDTLSIARLLSKIENRSPELPSLMRQIYPKTGGARVIGITGPPGAGKSTLVDRLTALIRKNLKQKVAIVAVDPSSPFSGGAILGDRIRMQNHTGDAGVFIRSLGTRGKHGGLSHSTKEVVLALDACGFDWILVETAGVGQTELDVLRLAQTVLVVVVPESGDSIQVMKAGLMEIADVFSVNKSDRPEADKMVRELVTMVSLGGELRSGEGGGR
jgi:LAO/AO transport system kinase